MAIEGGGGESPSTAYSFTWCCDPGTSIIFNDNGTLDYISFPDIYEYIGAPIVTPTGTVQSNQCYEINKIPKPPVPPAHAALPANMPDLLSGPTTCGGLESQCPSCTKYYTFNDCCTGEPFQVDGSTLVFEYEYIGQCVPGACPEDMLGKIITAAFPECGGECPPIIFGCLELTEVPGYDDLATVYLFSIINSFESFPTCEDCQICPQSPVYYTLNDCCTGEPYILNGLPNPDLNDKIAVFAYTGTCFPGTCPGDIISSIITSVSAEGFNTYIEGCLQLTEIQELPVDSAILEWENSLQDVTSVPSCEDCQTCYYEITNCADSNEKYCTTSNLSLYIKNGISDPFLWPVIQVLQYPNKCFYVLRTADVCTSPTVITKDPAVPAFAGCVKCQNTLIVYYELINCNNTSVIIYTSTDLQEYIGRYITLEEYGDQCFYVSIAEGLIPSDVTVVPTGDTFSTCQECSLQRYILNDCCDAADPIVTQVDLSEHVGKIITLTNCPDICWEVSETDINSIPVTEVDIKSSYDECVDCQLAKKCKCLTLTNNITRTIYSTYIDCEGNVIEGENVLPGQTSAKVCALTFCNEGFGVVTEYGDCINNQCPEIPKPKRKVTPGYDTPACTPEYYEKVECAFSEWMYKDVLEQRYGISNCCPDELIKWEIKHEMLMLDSLINPDYTCAPPVNCGCATPSSCNCSCNSGN